MKTWPMHVATGGVNQSNFRVWFRCRACGTKDEYADHVLATDLRAAVLAANLMVHPCVNGLTDYGVLEPYRVEEVK